MGNIIKEIGDRFFKELDKKNGWGKNEVKQLYTQVAYEVLSEKINSEVNHDS